MGMKNYCYTPDYCGELNNSVERLTGEKSQLESENADLQAKLEGAEKELRFEEQTSAFWKGRSEKADTDRDNLQAQVGVLREGLQEIRKYASNAFKTRDTVAFNSAAEVYAIINEALKTTPAKAGERVQYLVTVATDVLNWLQQNKLGDTGHGRCLADALEKYRGGTDI